MKKTAGRILIITFILSLFISTNSLAVAEEKYYMDKNVINTGKDNGYSGNNPIESNDVHFGWRLGRFFIKGYTQIKNKESDNPIFLKNLGDKTQLWFNLEQDINKLNKNERLSISYDKGAYDNHFGIAKQDFKKGALIIKKINYQGFKEEPVIFFDFLNATAKPNADTVVKLFEEGDYEVGLDYEIKHDPRKIFGQSIIPEYSNYKIYFKFSIRNGNAMIHIFDLNTNSELLNNSIAKNGFKLDFAQSHFLDVNIKREVLTNSKDGLVEDTKFNKPAKDQETYTDEGIYTIKVKNNYTDQETEKIIYVGDNSLLKAHVVSGLTIAEINNEIKNGSTISPTGELIKKTSVSNEGKKQIEKPREEKKDKETPKQESRESENSINRNKYFTPTIIAIAILAITISMLIFKRRKKNLTKNNVLVENNKKNRSDINNSED